MQRQDQKILDNAFDGLGNMFADLVTGKSKGGGLLSIFGLAEGGPVSGPGTGTSDSIPTMLSNGEFVINAQSSRKYRALLHAINSGSIGHMAMGGLVGPPVMPALGRGGGAHSASTITFAPQIDARGASVEAVARLEGVMQQQQRDFYSNVVTAVRRGYSSMDLRR